MDKLNQAEKAITSWTNQQRSALDANRENLLISAAAGSGKTAVLTERIFNLLTDPKDPISFSEIVAITFTRAAAASLKEKLSQRIERAISQEPKNPLYRKLALELPHAAISTVHAFCMRVIRENTAVLGLPPRLSLAGDAECERMKSECMRETLNRVFGERNAQNGPDQTKDGAYYLISRKYRRGADVTDSLLKLYDQLMALEGGVSHLSALCRESRARLENQRAEGRDFLSTPLGELAGEQIRATLKTVIGRIPVYLNFFPPEEQKDETVLPHAHDLMRTAEAAEALVRDGDFDSFARLCRGFKASTYTNHSQTFKRGTPEADRCKEYYDSKIKKPFVALCKDYACEPDRLMDDEAHRLDVQELFCKILVAFDEAYTERKRAAGLLDYSDLEHLALKVFTADSKTPHNTYCRALFVDEYQDTNRLQDAIFRSCVGDDGFFFFVGDVKQSIYRFRNAAPDLFLTYKNEFESYGEKSDSSARGTLGKSIFFSSNFRSDDTIIRFANRVFSVLMNDNVNHAERMYREDDRLEKRKKSKTEKPVEFHLLSFRATENKLGEHEFIAQRILKLIHEEHYRPEQIAVIAAGNRFLSKLRHVLQKAGVPANPGNAELFDSVEVESLCALLNVLDNPLSDIPLVSLCTSALFSFSSEELEEIRAYANGPFWIALVTAAERSNLTPIAERARLICNWVEHWRGEAMRLRPSALLLRLFRQGSVLSALSGGDELRRKNLLKIYREALDLESGETATFPDLIRHLKSRKKQSVQSESDAEIHPGYVTLMTVHKSKGLEFPVCIYAELGKKGKTPPSLLFDPKRGLFHPLYRQEAHCFCSPLAARIVRRQEQQQQREEEKRLLYVGITRAEEKLILVDAKGQDFRERFATTGVEPYLDEHSIHSRDLNTFGDLLLYSLREEEDLRRLANEPIGKIQNETYTINLVSPEEILAPEDAQRKIAKKKKDDALFSKEDAARLAESLAAYRRRRSRALLPSKLSVSELLHQSRTDSPDAESELSFGRENRIGATRGTAMHAFMQFCDFTKAKADAETEAARLLKRAFLSEEQVKLLNFSALSRFFTSPTFRALEKSPRVKRELRFNVFLPLASLIETEEEGDVLVQGVIDCFYEKEDGTYAILDFKTDAVKESDGEAVLLARHARQLTLYAEALRELTGKEVTSCEIYSFALGRSVCVPL